jgi:hypothetical protein
MADTDERQAVICRHCGRHLTMIPYGWIDENGIAVCQKYTGPLPVPECGYMLHEPMPAGLRGGA